MNPKHQQFLTDEWLPPDREIATDLVVDPDGCAIFDPGTENRWIRAEAMTNLADKQ